MAVQSVIDSLNAIASLASASASRLIEAVQLNQVSPGLVNTATLQTALAADFATLKTLIAALP